MTFSTVVERSNIAFRTTDGQRSVVWPIGLGLDDVLDTLPSCSGCSQLATDNPTRRIGVSIPVGETKFDRLASDEKLTIEWAFSVHRPLWALDYIQNGMPFNLALNVGQANNVELRETYEIEAVDGATLTVRGKNPKRITFNVGAVNPEWPLEANRLVYTAAACAMPPGAMVRFLYPSCLHQKLRPYIKKINVPTSNAEDDVSFSIELSHPVSACLAPVDAKYPAETYYCEIIWPQNAAPTVPNLQVIGETQFTLRREETTSAGVFTFTDTAGGNTRVLYPDMFAGALVVLIYRTDGSVESLDTASILERLSTTQTGASSWTSTIDLSDYAGADFEKALLIYRPEAVSDDDPYRLLYASHCANCQVDKTESYSHHGGAHCTFPACSKLATFKAGCWQPDCDGFCLGNEHAGHNSERMVDPPAEVRDAGKYWSCLWNRASLYVEQQIAGASSTRNFQIAMPSGGGYSFESIIGGFSDEVLGGLFPTRYPLFEATMGQRVTETDEDGDTTHEVIHGAFYARSEQDAASSVAVGALPAKLGAALGTLPDEWAAQMPDWIGCANVYSYASGGGSFGSRSENLDNQESFATALDLAEPEDTSLSDAIRERFS